MTLLVGNWLYLIVVGKTAKYLGNTDISPVEVEYGLERLRIIVTKGALKERFHVLKYLLLTALLSVPAQGAVVVFEQDADPGLGSRNSNIVTNPRTDQQIADDFVVLSSGVDVTQIDLWFSYRDDIDDQVAGAPPVEQEILLRVFDDVDGDPGAVVFQESVTIRPTATGVMNGFLTPNEIFYTEVNLVTPFQPQAGVRYWLSPLGALDTVTWQWQLSAPVGERRTRGGVGPPEWRDESLSGNPLQGNFAFRLHAVPEPSSSLFFLVGGLWALRRRR